MKVLSFDAIALNSLEQNAKVQLRYNLSINANQELKTVAENQQLKRNFIVNIRLPKS
jgi:hypothetical protein